MLLFHLEFRDGFAWELDGADPILFSLPTTVDWFLLNPLFYGNLQPVGRQPNGNHFGRGVSGRCFGTTHKIVFATKRELTIEGRNGELASLLTIAKDLLARLRHLSGQATMPRVETWVVSTFLEIPDLPPHDSPPQVSGYSVASYLFATAITAEHLIAAMTLGDDFVPPIQEILLLDAIAAHKENDFRTAILYAAMSIEVAFGSVIDAAYVGLIGNPSDARHRVIGIPQAGGTLVYKDPVYERLRSRTDFSVLLNELSLYVLHRSLLLEDESLFQQAKRLYTTRNKIVHSGELREEDTKNLHAFDVTGSMEALTTAVHLFSWLGERSKFALPSTGFTSI
jgi:hypothetical protein